LSLEVDSRILKSVRNYLLIDRRKEIEMLPKMKQTLVVLLIALITASVLSFSPVYAATTIYVQPAEIKNTSYVPGTLFNITLWVGDVIDLFGWQVKLTFNPAILNVKRGIFPPDHVFAGKPFSPLGPIIDNAAGSVLSGATLLGDVPRFSGTGKLIILEFEVMGVGSSALAIIEADTNLLDFDLNDIPYTAIDGYFENKPPPPNATMYVDPPKIVDPTLIPSTTFDVNVTIANATDVDSFEFKLTYDPSIVTVVSAVLGDFFPPVTPIVTINNVAGVLVFNASLTAPPPRSGDGILAVVTFHVEGLGVSTLDLYDTKLVDPTNAPLPQDPPQDGFFNNVLMAKLYVDPPEISDPLMKPPRIFSVDIMIDDVEDLYGYEFKLSYNTAMLTAIGVDIHPILGEHSFATSMMVDDDTGLIWVKVRYYAPAIPIITYTPESLVTLTFKVDAVGSSLLDLHDTKLTDSTSTLIPHEATDGFVWTEIHDVAIVNVVPSTSFVFAGTPVYIDVTAKNKGNVSETFDVKAFYDTNLIGTQTVTNLPAGAETTLAFTWDTTGVSDGIYTIKGEAALVPYEFNPADNVHIDGTVEVRTRIRDLAILSVTPNTNATYAHPLWPVNITVVAENQGMDPETFDVTVYWNETHLIGKQTVNNLLPSTSVTLFFIWDTSNALVCHKYLISANATILEFEMDTADNWLDDGYVKIKIMGDVNEDGKVDIKDLATLSLAFGSYPGHPRWNPDADLNKDNRVDIRDIAMGASNFGKTCQ